jgi:arylsulfatase A-like enzyme
MYALAGPRVTSAETQAASILDIAPTALEAMELPVPPDLGGRNLLNGVSP